MFSSENFKENGNSHKLDWWLLKIGDLQDLTSDLPSPPSVEKYHTGANADCLCLLYLFVAEAWCTQHVHEACE